MFRGGVQVPTGGEAFRAVFFRYTRRASKEERSVLRVREHRVESNNAVDRKKTSEMTSPRAERLSRL